MTAHIDYTTLGTPATRLRLDRSAGGYYSALDQHDRLCCPPSDLDTVIQYMRARAFRGDAVLDEDSISLYRALARRTEKGTNGGADSLRVPVTSAATDEPTSPLNVGGVPDARKLAPSHLHLITKENA